MAENTAEKFIDALEKLEADHDLETMVQLFSDDSEVGNVVMEDKDKSLDARKFWQNYRNNFGEVSSTFLNKIITEKTAALEWTTTGTSAEGNNFEYDGVSILEFEGDKITRFHAYFDPNKLGQQIVEEKSQGA